MAMELGIADKTNKQRTRVNAIRRGVAKLIAPQPKGLPGWLLAPCQADHIWPLAGLRHEFEVGIDDLLIVI
jgi:hypothetical protein